MTESTNLKCNECGATLCVTLKDIAAGVHKKCPNGHVVNIPASKGAKQAMDARDGLLKKAKDVGFK
jgi:phage FluMu protein Com